MNVLLPGLRKFSEKVFPKQQALFQKLSNGQKPHTLMITCSDSRIDPSLFTQTQPGEIFVVRNAGNIVPPVEVYGSGEGAAIEIAIDGLGITNIVICGHSQCSAMAALTNPNDLANLPAVKSWLRFAARTKERVDAMPNGYTPLQAVEANVLVQAENIRTHPSVRRALANGSVQIFAWVYHIEIGSIMIYDPTTKVFRLSSEVKDDVEADVSRFAL